MGARPRILFGKWGLGGHWRDPAALGNGTGGPQGQLRVGDSLGAE